MAEAIEMRALRDGLSSVGGPWLLDRLQFVLLGVPLVLIVSLGLSGASTSEDYATFLLQNFFLFGFVMFTIELAHRSIFSSIRERPANPILVFGFGAALGALFYLFRWSLDMWLWGLNQLIRPGELLLFSAAGAILIPVASILERARRRSRVKRRLELERSVRPIDQSELTAQLMQIFDDLSENVSATFLRLRGEKGITGAEALERVIRDCIKPLSKSLSYLTRPAKRYFVIRGTTSEALGLRPFGTPVLLAFAYSSSFWIVNFLLDRGESAWIPALVSFLMLSLATKLAQLSWSKRRIGSGLTAIFLFSSLMSLPITSVNQLYLLDSIQLVGYLAGLVLNTAIISLIAGAASLIFFNPEKQAGRYRDMLLKGDTGSLNQAFRALAYRRLSQKLHGAVQSDVLALQLSQASEQAVDFLALEQEVLEIINRARDEFVVETETPLAARLVSLTEKWAFMAKVTINNLCQGLSPIQENVCFMLIQEAVTNSVRHGSATKIDIHLSEADSGVFKLVVVDNGTGPLSRNSKAGTGMSILAELTEDEYSLTVAEGGGAKLVATIYS